MGQIEDPHCAEDVPAYIQHIQFYVPQNYGRVESFVSRYIAEVIIKGDLVFQLADWSPWDEARVYVIKSLWPEFDETKNQGFGGGLLFSQTESSKALALFSLVTVFGWKCYLYSDDLSPLQLGG